jgi:hypothetical protein
MKKGISESGEPPNLAKGRKNAWYLMSQIFT